MDLLQLIIQNHRKMIILSSFLLIKLHHGCQVRLQVQFLSTWICFPDSYEANLTLGLWPPKSNQLICES